VADASAFIVSKAKEYAFFFYAMLAAIVYGVAHDHVTATISPTDGPS
jgi:hypothetical protein